MWEHQFAEYLTPKQAHKKMPELGTLKEFQERAKYNQECDVCGMRPAWRLTGLGMCFTCTTGESDAGEDFELELTNESN